MRRSKFESKDAPTEPAETPEDGEVVSTDNDTAFPVGVLPALLEEFVVAVADSKVVDVSMTALPLLSAMAAAIGGARRVAIKPDWHEPCSLWTAIVAPSGSGKTPAAAPVLRAVRDRDADAVANNARVLAEFEDDLVDFERGRRKRKPNEPPVERPRRPSLPRFHVQDVTPEQLLALLGDNPRGALMVRDELSGLFGGFGRYSEGKGAAERSKYLSIWSCELLSDDRKVAASVYVRRPMLSIFGGVQPELLFRSLSVEDCAAGLPARFLFAWPDSPPRRWSDESVPAALTDKLAEVFAMLYSLEMVEHQLGNAAGDDDRTEWRPVDVPLTGHARDAFRRWHDETHAPHVDAAHGALRAAYSKMPAQCGRLALVLHLASWACGEGADARMIDEESVANAIRLTEWFRRQADRVYSLKHENEVDRERRELVELIRRKGGTITPRDLQRASRQWPSAESAERALRDLVEHGKGTINSKPPTKSGGRPTQVFELKKSGATD